MATTAKKPDDVPSGTTTKADVAETPRDVVDVYAEPGQFTATAAALLATAEKLGLDPSVVVMSDGHYQVPKAVADGTKPPAPEKPKAE